MRPTTTIRVEQVEDWLARGITTHRAATLAKEEWGLSRRQASRYVSLAFARWAAESQRKRPEKRAQMRAALWDAYGKCLDKTSMASARNGEGGVEWEEYPDPDMKAGAKYLELLCRLDGLLEQAEGNTVEVHLSLIGQMQQVYGLGDGVGRVPKALAG
jgi:hypothetical protein